MFAVSVAAARRLHHIVHPRQNPNHTAKGKIDPGFDQLGGNTDHSFVIVQRRMNGLQCPKAVFHTHGGGKMERSWLQPQLSIQPQRLGLGVADEQHAPLLVGAARNKRRQFFRGIAPRDAPVKDFQRAAS